MSTHPNPDQSEIEIDAYARYLSGKSPDDGAATRGAWLLGVGFGIYSAAAVMLSWAGIYSTLSPLFFAGTVVASMTSLIAAYYLVPSVRAFVEHLGPYGLATFHIWRIPAALAFLYYGSQGWLPDLFVILAGWGDMLAGVIAAGLIIFPVTLNRIKWFHVIGFADFVVAVGTGLSLQLLATPLMSNIAYLPIALIPLVGVPLSGASHIAAFDLLRKSRSSTL